MARFRKWRNRPDEKKGCRVGGGTGETLFEKSEFGITIERTEASDSLVGGLGPYYRQLYGRTIYSESDTFRASDLFCLAARTSFRKAAACYKSE
jgi:hypothetical protein